MTMAEKCEIAHEQLKKECKKLNITMDKTDENGNLAYTEKAQDIFNKLIDNLEECFHDTFKNSKVELVELVDEMEIEVECENCGKKGTINYSYTSDNWK